MMMINLTINTISTTQVAIINITIKINVDIKTNIKINTMITTSTTTANMTKIKFKAIMTNNNNTGHHQC